jgi:hypothetical protein
LGGGAGAPDDLGATTDRSTAADPRAGGVYRTSIGDIDIGRYEVEDAPSSFAKGFL